MHHTWLVNMQIVSDDDTTTGFIKHAGQHSQNTSIDGRNFTKEFSAGGHPPHSGVPRHIVSQVCMIPKIVQDKLKQDIQQAKTVAKVAQISQKPNKSKPTWQ